MAERDFNAALLDPELPVPEGLIGPQGRPAGKRFDVYRNNVTASLAEALSVGFPALEARIGAQNFRKLAILYLRAHPPRSRRMAEYGEEMPAFLEGFAPLAAHPDLPDLARLELAIRASYHAADALALDTGALDPAMVMEMRPRLAPATRVLASDHPVLSIYRNVLGQTPEIPRARAEAVLITRPEFDPEPHLLPDGGLALLRLLDGKTPMGEVMERVMKAHPKADLGTLLALIFGRAALTL